VVLTALLALLALLMVMTVSAGSLVLKAMMVSVRQNLVMLLVVRVV
jgi:hypothetical protein